MELSLSRQLDHDERFVFCSTTFEVGDAGGCWIIRTSILTERQPDWLQAGDQRGGELRLVSGGLMCGATTPTLAGA